MKDHSLTNAHQVISYRTSVREIRFLWRQTLSIGTDLMITKFVVKRPISWKMHIKETHIGPLCKKNSFYGETYFINWLRNN